MLQFNLSGHASFSNTDYTLFLLYPGQMATQENNVGENDEEVEMDEEERSTMVIMMDVPAEMEDIISKRAVKKLKRSCNFKKQHGLKLWDGLIEILHNAFQGCDQLARITIPSTCTLIGRMAFAELPRLKEVTLLGSLTTIGNRAFHRCESLERLTIEQSVTDNNSSDLNLPYIGEQAFEGCSSLSQVTLSEGLVSIKEEAFCGCTSLETIVIPSTVREIAKNAFNGCTSLETVVISSTIGEIVVSAFSGCHENLVVTID